MNLCFGVVQRRAVEEGEEGDQRKKAMLRDSALVKPAQELLAC